MLPAGPDLLHRLGAELPIFQAGMGGGLATAGPSDNLVDAGPLYRRECVAWIDDIGPAGEIVRNLAP